MITSVSFKPIVTLAAILGLFMLGVQSVSGLANGYATDDTMLKPGMAVAISESSTDEVTKVERASNENPYRIIGIAADPTESEVTIASENQPIYVTTSGDAKAYVSDLDGEIKKGDLLAISPLKGILSKASDDSPVTLGVALENSADKVSEDYIVQSAAGEKTVKIFSIRINFDNKAGGGGKEADSSLERLGRSISGKDIGEIRVVAAIIIFIIVLIAEASILYGAISSAITSLGRNPLARKIIKHELIRVVIVAIAVLFFGLGAIYLILRV
jgi:hypothetical protein